MSHTVIFGVHAAKALLQQRLAQIQKIQLQQGFDESTLSPFLHMAKTQGIAIEWVSKQTLNRMTHDALHQGIAIVCQATPICTEKDLKQWLTTLTQPPFLLILDGVQDPHNLGACFRVADAAGVHAIIAPKDHACSITGAVSKAASGASETIPFFQVTNLARVMVYLKEAGIWIYGATAEATQSLYCTSLSGPMAIVLGGEGVGLRRLTREHCDALIAIPMQGLITSVNVSVAAGIVLFEVVRQRLANPVF